METLKKMTGTDFHDFLHELPKCEHHVHLEGTLSPELLLELSKRNNVSLPAGFPTTAEELYDRYSKFTDLQSFLDDYFVGMSVLRTRQDFADLAYNYFKKAHSDNVVHVEAFFDPQAHTDAGTPFDDVVAGFTDGRRRAEEEFGISTKLIMCFLRHLSPESAHETLIAAKPHYAAGAIHGLGLSSSEKGYPPEIFEEVYATAHEFNFDINFTSHAGEEGDHTYVERALDRLNVSRIDHGVRSVESKELLKRLALNKTMLTVCPISNLRLRGVDCISKVPLRQLLEAGVPFSINSDDPAYFGGYMLDNYLAVHKHFNFDVDTWVLIVRNSILGSWVGDNKKTHYLNKLEAVRAKYAHLTV